MACVCLCLYGWIVYCCLFVFLCAAAVGGVAVVVLFIRCLLHPANYKFINCMLRRITTTAHTKST